MVQRRPLIYTTVPFLFVTTLVSIPVPTNGFRKTIYEVESDNSNRKFLRGNSFSRHRKYYNDEKSDYSFLQRDLDQVPGMPDGDVLGYIENRRFNSMETIFEAEKLMFALRLSMSMDMSLSLDLSMPMVSYFYLFHLKKYE